MIVSLRSALSRAVLAVFAAGLLVTAPPAPAQDRAAEPERAPGATQPATPPPPASEMPVAETPFDEAALRDTGRELTRMFYDGEIQPLWDRMEPQMHEALGSVERLTTFQQQVTSQLGAEQARLDEQLSTRQGYRLYLRRVHFANSPDDWGVRWVIDSEGVIVGFFIQPWKVIEAAAAAEGSDDRGRPQPEGANAGDASEPDGGRSPD